MATDAIPSLPLYLDRELLPILCLDFPLILHHHSSSLKKEPRELLNGSICLPRAHHGLFVRQRVQLLAVGGSR